MLKIAKRNENDRIARITIDVETSDIEALAAAISENKSVLMELNGILQTAAGHRDSLIDFVHSADVEDVTTEKSSCMPSKELQAQRDATIKAMMRIASMSVYGASGGVE